MSPCLNDFGSPVPVAFLAATPPVAFFGPPVEGRAIFFLGSAAVAATVEEGLVLDDAGLASEPSATWGASAGAVTSSDDIWYSLKCQRGRYRVY